MRPFLPEGATLMAQCRNTTAGMENDHPITRCLWLLLDATAQE